MSDKERIRVQIKQIKEQIERAWLQIRGTEYIWPRQMDGFKRLKKELDEKLRVLEEEYVNE